MNITDLKTELQSTLGQRRASNLAVTTGTQQWKWNWKLIGLLAAGGLTMVWLATSKPKSEQASKPVGNFESNPQMEQAMSMLQQQQAMNDKLLQGQQELNALLIKEQGKQKQLQPNVNCFLAVCPGTASTQQPSQDYAIVGESIRTATVDPARVLPQLTQPQLVTPEPAQAQQLPETYGEVQQVSAPVVDVFEQEYHRLSEALVSNPQAFYDTAWQWQPNINSSEPIPTALRRIFAEIPLSRPY